MDKVVSGKSQLLLVLLSCASACWAESKGENRELVNVNARFAQIGFAERTYADSIPAKMQTVISPVVGKMEGGVDLLIDTTGGKELFPIERNPREFGDEKQLTEFMKKTFLLDSAGNDRKFGTYLRLGESYVFDPDPGIAYRVDDPILAHVGGAKGVVKVAGQAYCIDPDGKCDSDLASYLVPVGQPTALSDIDQCGTVIMGTPVCVHHHSFWNWTWFFGVYVRHGTNARFTTWAAVPSSELRLRFDLQGTGTARVVRTGTAVGQNSAEIAIFCWGDCSHDVANAQQICSRNVVIDPDIDRREVTTGNGPANHFDTIFCTVFV